jgi:hypothetical protein
MLRSPYFTETLGTVSEVCARTGAAHDSAAAAARHRTGAVRKRVMLGLLRRPSVAVSGGRLAIR